MISGTFMTTCRKQKWWEICFNSLKLYNIGVQTLTRSYHEEQQTDYLKGCNVLHDSPISYSEFANSCYMKANMFDRIEEINYSCYIFLPFMFFKPNMQLNSQSKKWKWKADYVPTPNTHNKIYKTTCHPWK